MRTFQMGKLSKQAIKVAVIGSGLLLSACDHDENSNSAPAFDAEPVSNNVAIVGQVYNESLSASDADDDVLLYTLVAGPGWLTVRQNGTLLGDHGEADIGSSEVTVSASDGNRTVETTFTLVVEAAPNNLPTPAVIANTQAFESKVFNEPLTSTDADADPLTFSIVSGPDWLTIADGALQGTPAAADVGLNDVVVAVTDGIDIVEVTFSITVEELPVNAAPGVPAIDINAATEGVSFSATLTATDAENDALTFTLDDGSADWLAINGSTLSGTPGSTDVGQNDIHVIVSDGLNVNSAQTLSIIVAGTAPTDLVIANNNVVVENTLFTAQLSATMDTQDDLLSFSIESGPAWLTADSATGALSGTPANSDIGTNTFNARATDINNAVAELTFDVAVEAEPIVNVAPSFINPINYKPGGGEGTDYALANQALADLASDDNGDILTFAIIDGPAWLSVAADGTMSGILTNLDGDNTFTVEVSDGALSAQATLNITKALWQPEELHTTSQAVGRAYSSTLAADNGFGTLDTLSFSEVAGDAANLFALGADGAVTSNVLTAADIGAHEIQHQVTNSVQSSSTPDLGSNTVTILNVSAVTAITGAVDSFGVKVFDGWVNESSKNILLAPGSGGNPGALLRVKGGSRAIKYFDSSGFSGLTLSYDRKLENLFSAEDETYAAEWSADGSTWNLIEELNNDTAGQDVWLSQSWNLPVEAAGQAILAIRFRTSGTNNTSRVNLDNVALTGTP